MFYLCLKSILYWLQRLILNSVDGENDLHHEFEMVGYNRLNLYWVERNFVFFEEFAVNIRGLRGLWLKTIPYGDSSNVVVI